MLRQRQVNVLGFFLPLTVGTGAIFWAVCTAFSLPVLLACIPVALFLGVTAATLWRTRRAAQWETAAVLLDEKTCGQERFLTLATLSRAQSNALFLHLLRRQAASRVAAFEPTRDLPFTLDKRILPMCLGAALCLLLLFFVRPAQYVLLVAPIPSLNAELGQLEETARALMTQGASPQEQAAGAQLLVLVQELKDPSLPPQEKRRLIDEAQKRMNLPLPQLLPFDLQLFASKSKKTKGKGTRATNSSQTTILWPKPRRTLNS